MWPSGLRGSFVAGWFGPRVRGLGVRSSRARSVSGGTLFRTAHEYIRVGLAAPAHPTLAAFAHPCAAQAKTSMFSILLNRVPPETDRALSLTCSGARCECAESHRQCRVSTERCERDPDGFLLGRVFRSIDKTGMIFVAAELRARPQLLVLCITDIRVRTPCTHLSLRPPSTQRAPPRK